MRHVSVATVVISGFLALCTGCATGARLGLISGENNPTTFDGRGKPSLDDKDRPAAWIYIDGQRGRFTEREGQPLLQWVIDKSVSPTPSFRVDVYEPLLGNPADFKCVLQTNRAENGSYISYGIAANEGTFKVGRDYSLLNPGDNFTIRIAGTDDLVEEIAPLAPGTYALVGKVADANAKAEGLAVTYFTVGASKPSATE